MNSEPSTVVFYHAGCPDGFGAAWAAWKKYGDRASYVPVSYTDIIVVPEGTSCVFFVDFCPPKEILEALVRCVPTVWVFDHHHTAASTLREVKGIYYTFDNERSGAVITWQELHGKAAKVPDLLLYIQDRDLWMHELPNTREVSAALEAVPRDFKAWDRLDILDLMQSGRLVLRVKESVIAGQCEIASDWITIDGHLVPVVNSPAHQSDSARYLLEKHPEAQFAAYYYDIPGGKRKWGLRSREPDTLDVSAIAVKFGGGGHKGAAGFSTDQTWRGDRVTHIPYHPT